MYVICRPQYKLSLVLSLLQWKEWNSVNFEKLEESQHFIQTSIQEI